MKGKEEDIVIEYPPYQEMLGNCVDYSIKWLMGTETDTDRANIIDVVGGYIDDVTVFNEDRLRKFIESDTNQNIKFIPSNKNKFIKASKKNHKKLITFSKRNKNKQKFYLLVVELKGKIHYKFGMVGERDLIHRLKEHHKKHRLLFVVGSFLCKNGIQMEREFKKFIKKKKGYKNTYGNEYFIVDDDIHDVYSEFYGIVKLKLNCK